MNVLSGCSGFYLLACENYFAHGYGMVFQIQLTHRQGAVPLTRAYIAEKEAQFADRLCQTALSGKQNPSPS